MFSTIPQFNAFCKVRNEFRLSGTPASFNVKKKFINIIKPDYHPVLAIASARLIFFNKKTTVGRGTKAHRHTVFFNNKLFRILGNKGPQISVILF
jgi:hypothetical protein